MAALPGFSARQGRACPLLTHLDRILAGELARRAKRGGDEPLAVFRVQWCAFF